MTNARICPPPRHASAARAFSGLGLLARLAVCLALAAPAADAGAQVHIYDTAATHAIVVDADTGQSLLEKNPDDPVPPASMSKLMTAAMAFEALSQGRLSLEDRFPVSQNAFRKEGSTMFLNLTDEPTVAELLRGVIVQSGNDACIVLAEGLAGSEAVFGARMTRRGEEIGLSNSTFMNATGLPHPEHRMSVRDLATLALHIIRDYPQFYPIYSEREFKWAGVDQRNRNPLLYMDLGGDGLKTGYTEEAGYGMVGSAVQGGRRVVAVIAGLPSQRSRTLEIRRVLSWAFREFEHRTLAKAGEPVGAAEVWIGDAPTVELVLAEDLRVAMPIHAEQRPAAVIRYRGPVAAPIAEGQEIATLKLEVDGMTPIERPLRAARAVARGGYFAKLSAGLGSVASWALSPLTDGGESE